MATGDQFTNIVEKRIMGYQDFGAYFFDYVRTLLRDAIKKMFTLNGTFGSTKINITSSANDTFRLDSNREGADSYGHIMANSDSGTNYAFQNTAAQTYQVGFKYGEHPVLLAINPRTAFPEFTRYEESLGEVAAPNSVVDNGTNLTLVVDSVTEAGVTNAGRSVRVWKIYPGTGATTLAAALETCTVSWNGSNNVVTTTGLFGQTTPSTTAADYLVQLVGPTVKRDTDIKDSSYWYLGEITGNGPAATPVGFDMTDQNLIPFSLSEAQDSANIVSAAIADSPSSLAAGTVFAQLTELLGHVNDRGRTGYANSWTGIQTFGSPIERSSVQVYDRILDNSLFQPRWDLTGGVPQWRKSTEGYIGCWRSNYNAGAIRIPLRVPVIGTSFTIYIDIVFTPGTIRTGANRMYFQLAECIPLFVSTFGGNGSYLDSDYDDGTANKQIITLSASPTPQNDRFYYVMVTAGNDGGSNWDEIYQARIRFSHNIVAPPESGF